LQQHIFFETYFEGDNVTLYYNVTLNISIKNFFKNNFHYF